MKKLIKLNPLTISITSIAIGIFAYLYEIPFLDLMEYKTIDLRFTSREEITPSPHVVLAVVDEKSLSKEGKWVWPRSKMADLITKLSDAGARVVVLDIGFLEPDDKRVAQAIDEIQLEMADLDILDVKLENYLKNLKAQTDHDKLLADTIRNSKAKVVLGYFFQTEHETSHHIDEKDISVHQENIINSRYEYVRYLSADAMKAPFIEAQAPQSNIAVISNAAEYSGCFNMIPDADGVVRRMPAVFKFNETIYAPLSLQAVSAFLDTPPSLRVAEYGVEALKVGDLFIPTDEIGRIMINYRGEEKTFPHISVTDILHDNVVDGTFQDKIVMVGVTATAVYDVRVTPFANIFPGLEIHANIVDSILTEDFLFRPAWSQIFDIFAILLGGLLLGTVLPRTGVVAGALLGGVLFFGYIGFCQFLFAEKGLIINLVYPLSVILLMYVSITAYKYLTESKQKKFVRDTFETFLAPAVVKQLMDSPDIPTLGGEERVITAFFSDIQGFTSISEKLTAVDLVDLLNEFLGEMADIILDYEGMVDKFEGDAVIAIFGAPNEIDNQAEIACKACIDMQKRLIELRENWKAVGKPEIQMRIGLCTGPAVVGNMGSRSRMDYTMMGDTVNTAARLEGVNKVYGIYTLIGESTYKEAGNSVVSREIDLINVVGKKEPVKVYQLLGYPDDIDERLREIVDNYQKGLYAYRDQDWDKAVSLFNSVLALDPDDGPSKTMLERCDELKANPPGEDWDGSYTMRTK